MTTDPSIQDIEKQIDEFRESYRAVAEQLGRVIVGHQLVRQQVLTCLLAGGHALLEGVPGLGKTLLVRTLADALDLSFSRVQFTPDLMPADITGTNIVVTSGGDKSFRFQPGPIFANLVLADEINRATPKTQSAVLEAMQEHTVSVSRETHRLPEPFLVLATQNPLEMEGTYPLPEAQLDRFLFKITMNSPAVEDVITILDRTTGAEVPAAEAVVDADCVLSMQQLVRGVPVARDVKEAVARVLLNTHPDRADSPEVTRKYVRYGASPRGAQAIVLAGKVAALRDGRSCVSYDDVRAVTLPALRHRLILSFEGQAEGIEPDDILQQVLTVSLPD
ncbi:MAG: AAA family ATPase [Phycisphaerae bacterium]